MLFVGVVKRRVVLGPSLDCEPISVFGVLLREAVEGELSEGAGMGLFFVRSAVGRHSLRLGVGMVFDFVGGEAAVDVGDFVEARLVEVVG